MVVPNLIHPIPIVIRRQRQDLTTFNSRSREPIRQLWRDGDGPGTGTETTLEGQVNYNTGRQGKPAFRAGGVEEESEGYVLFRLVDLLAAGVAVDNGDGTYDFGLKRGDQIVRVGRRRTNYYVSFFRDIASYDDQAGATILEVNFMDRMPESPDREVS